MKDITAKDILKSILQEVENDGYVVAEYGVDSYINEYLEQVLFVLMKLILSQKIPDRNEYNEAVDDIAELFIA